jgi:hypothetical protein
LIFFKFYSCFFIFSFRDAVRLIKELEYEEKFKLILIQIMNESIHLHVPKI